MVRLSIRLEMVGQGYLVKQGLLELEHLLGLQQQLELLLELGEDCNWCRNHALVVLLGQHCLDL